MYAVLVDECVTVDEVMLSVVVFWMVVLDGDNDVDDGEGGCWPLQCEVLQHSRTSLFLLSLTQLFMQPCFSSMTVPFDASLCNL